MKNNKNIEISALRVFSAVAEAESLTQAAERLGITQSAVSQTIKQLELQAESQQKRHEEKINEERRMTEAQRSVGVTTKKWQK